METPETLANHYLSRNATIDIGGALSRGWALVKDNMGVLIGATLLSWVVTAGLSFLPLIGQVIGFVMLGSLDFLFLRRLRGEQVEIGDVFAGFSQAFIPLALAGLLKVVLTVVGLILCILPGIYLGVCYVFALPLVLDKKYEFWTALEVSRRVVHAHWVMMFVLVIVLAIVACAGALACLVGLVFTVPLATAAFMYVYEDLFGERAAAVVMPPAMPASQF